MNEKKKDRLFGYVSEVGDCRDIRTIVMAQMRREAINGKKMESMQYHVCTFENSNICLILPARYP